MSIRLGNDFYKIPGLSSGNTRAVNSTKNTTGNISSSVSSSSFASALTASMATLGAGTVTGGVNTLYNSLSSTYPNLAYNLFDASNISQSYWGRNDFPMEALFGNGISSSILNWSPQGAEPSANSSQVLNRLNSTLGMKAIVIPPGLDTKISANPNLERDVLSKISDYIKGTDALFEGKERSDALIFDGNGNISHYKSYVDGEGIVRPSQEEIKKPSIYVANQYRKYANRMTL